MRTLQWILAEEVKTWMVKGEEARLIGQLVGEDPAVRKELFRKYHRVMRRRANSVLRDAEAAEDAVQDAWLAMLTSIGKFSGRSAVVTWLAGITQNCARNRRRNDRRFVPISALGPTERDSAQPVVRSDGAPLAFNALTPELLLLRREAMRHVESALERLPESQKSVVILRDVVGASSADACRLLAISNAAQRTRLHRGRASLRRELGASGPWIHYRQPRKAPNHSRRLPRVLPGEARHPLVFCDVAEELCAEKIG